MTIEEKHPYEVMTLAGPAGRFSNIACAVRHAADPDIRGWVRGPRGFLLSSIECVSEAQTLAELESPCAIARASEGKLAGSRTRHN